MSWKKHLTVISSEGLTFRTDREIINQIAGEQEVELFGIRTPPEIYSYLSNPTFQTSVIEIDIQTLYNQENVKAWDFINTLDTLIKSTVYRDGTGKPKKRNTIIVAGCTLDDDPKLIKDFLSMDDRVSGIFPRGDGFTIDEKRRAMLSFQNNEYHVPKKILELINPKKQKTKNEDIKLTPRQEQVLALIQERGASNKVIAKILKISESTVKLHVGQVIKKYGVKNRTQLALFSKPKI